LRASKVIREGPQPPNGRYGPETPSGGPPRRVYCLIPPDLAALVEERLRSFYADDPAVEVLVERRTTADRRGGSDLRSALLAVPAEDDDGRTVPARERRGADRRTPEVPLPPRRLPRGVRRHAGELRFFARAERNGRGRHDADAQRLVLRFQSGDRSAFDVLYTRYYDPIYRYARVSLRDAHMAEDIAQQTFTAVLKALPRYEVRAGTPFRAWLFHIARNEVLMYRRREGIVEQEDPQALDANGRHADGRRAATNGHARQADGHLGAKAFDWITDCDLMMLLHRLPDAQRQTVTLRYLLGLTTHETAHTLERSAEAVRQLEHRGLRFLRERLIALGRVPAEFGPPEYRRTAALASMRPAPVLGARREALAGALPSFAVAGTAASGRRYR
jgi:RNA polymerase sigma-70 factor (ECF subfamily)